MLLKKEAVLEFERKNNTTLVFLLPIAQKY